MTGTIHPWTMYEVVRCRDEERLLRAREAMQVMKHREERPVETVSTRHPAQPWLGRFRHHLQSLSWAQSHHLLPHARHG